MMRASPAKHISAKITKSTQTALQADGRTQLSVVGETHLLLIRHGRFLILEALIVEDLDVEILAGTPFMTSNDIAVCPANPASRGPFDLPRKVRKRKGPLLAGSTFTVEHALHVNAT